jgi:hypothetical protein
MRNGFGAFMLLLAILGPATAAPPDEPAAPVANPTGGGGSVVLEPAPPAAEPSATATRSRRLVFVCHDDAVPVFSDRPCSSEAARRELSVAHATGAPPSTIPPPPRAVPLGAAAPTPVAKRPADPCRRLREQLEELDDRMRSGYSAREAARLWKRWRELKSRIHQHRC